MRAQIENDRQLEGCFTSYSPALERSALKKDRYLNPAPVAPAALVPAPVTAKPSVPPPSPPPPPRPPAVAGNSLMAEKLLQAGLVRPKAN
jgi:3'-5' exoribonuclease